MYRSPLPAVDEWRKARTEERIRANRHQNNSARPIHGDTTSESRAHGAKSTSLPRCRANRARLIGSRCLDTIRGIVIELLETKASLHQLRLVPGCSHRRRKRISIRVELRSLLSDFAQLHPVIDCERAIMKTRRYRNAPFSWLRRRHRLVRISFAPRSSASSLPSPCPCPLRP